MTSLKPIATDLTTLVDPYKLLSLIASIDNQYSEILVSPTYNLIDVHFIDNNDPPVAVFDLDYYFDLFDSSDEEIMDHLKSLGIHSNPITNKNVAAGLFLFRRAYKKGLLRTYDFTKYAGAGIEYLNKSIDYREEVLLDAETRRAGKPKSGIEMFDMYDDLPVTIMPDWARGSLDGLIGAHIDMGIDLLIGNDSYKQHVEILRPDLSKKIWRDDYNVNPDISALLLSPMANSLDELLVYSENYNVIKRANEVLLKAKQKRDLSKDVGILALKFTGTLAADVLLFGGLPISSGLLFAYEVIDRIVLPKRK